jgi:hypothetical protein
MKLSDKYRQLAQQWYDTAKVKGVKFRNKDLRRLRDALDAGTFNDLLDLYYGASAKINEHGELVLGNPIVEVVTGGVDIFKLIDVDKEFSNIYHQPVVIGTAHGLKWGSGES